MRMKGCLMKSWSVSICPLLLLIISHTAQHLYAFQENDYQYSDLQKPILWNSNQVSIVILMCFNKRDEHYFNQYMETISAVLIERENVKKLTVILCDDSLRHLSVWWNELVSIHTHEHSVLLSYSAASIFFPSCSIYMEYLQERKRYCHEEK